jgi:hypothetical protein
MSGPIIRKYGFPNFDKIFGERPLEHGVDEAEPTDASTPEKAPTEKPKPKRATKPKATPSPKSKKA